MQGVRSTDSTARRTSRPAARTTMHPIVYFDLETTGLCTKSAGILQIAAKSQSDVFSAYVMPTVPIEPGASKIHGLTIQQGQLHRGNELLLTMTRREACSKFLDFLSDFEAQVILVAHNGFNFDVPLLVRDMKLEGLLEDLHGRVAGIVDTMDVFRAKLSHYGGPRNLKLATVAAHLGVPTHGAHDALRDTEMLQDACDRLKVSADEMWNFSKKLTRTGRLFRRTVRPIKEKAAKIKSVGTVDVILLH